MLRFLVVLLLIAAQTARAQDAVQQCVWSCLSAHGPATNPAYHQCVSANCSAGAASPDASPWAFIDPLMVQALGILPGEAGATFFPDHGDPGTATHGLAIHYHEGRTGGNAIGMTVGLFGRTAQGWQSLGRVEGLFGLDPRDPAFPPGQIEITTTTLGPNEPRCCPTVEARWSVDVATRRVLRLR